MGHLGYSSLFENCSICRIWIFEFWHFPPIFVLLKFTCLATLFDCKLQVFKNSPKWTILGIFNQLLSTQNINVNVARNVEWDFFCDFQTLWITVITKKILGICHLASHTVQFARGSLDLFFFAHIVALTHLSFSHDEPCRSHCVKT